METLYVVVAVVCTFVISLHTWKFLKWAWFDPKKQEKLVRQQGFNGNSYTFLVGDFKRMTRKAKEVESSPIPFTHDIAERTMAFFYEVIQKYGKNSFIWFGPKLSVMICDPDLVKEIFSKNYVFQKMSTPLDKLIAQGIAAYDTDKWAKHRKLINPAFHLEKVKHMLPSFHQTGTEMLSKWEDLAPKEGCWEIDVWPYLQTLTSDAISRTAFGSNYEEGRKIFELQRELGTLFMKSYPTLLVPGWRFLSTKVNKRMKDIGKQVESSILGIINKRMQAIEAGEASSDDLLGILLESNFKEIQENGNENGMSFHDVIEECKLFYIAGQTTTASLLVWTMVLLGKHLDWQARARDEVRQVFSGNNLADFQDLGRLKVMTMIFNEVLRLYPPGLILSRMIHTETKLKNMTLPAGVQLFLPTLMLHQDTNAWGTDAKEFNPERFSEGISKATKDQFSYFPFGGGPRICIGQNFAMLEAKMALSMILQRFAFEISPSYAHAPELGLALQPQYGAQLMFSKI